MSKTAKEMWADAGFKFMETNESGVIYSDIYETDTNLGATRIEIDRNGSFRGGIPTYETGYQTEFSPEMSKALFQQLKEFNIDRYKIRRDLRYENSI